ncbi:angiopoietin-4-like [Ruditapes philippinarum]|uniref:angiopoietin-4-like n=1 Tax=Ruditapes philippinarum TaxID=129788 RepID=UPI00295AB3A2|nr:angiopoietin-4-like [Ruditapes philippinarum]
MSTNVAHWKKFNFDEESVEPGCPAENARFIKGGVPDQVTCGRLCFGHAACESVLFRQEDHLCIGCQYFNRYLPSNAQMGFVHYSTRKIEVDCLDILEQNETAESGVYEVIFRELETVHVFCDMTTEGGGWTVFQNRFNGSVNFTKTFFDYENGFGDLNGEFWLEIEIDCLDILEQIETAESGVYEVIFRELETVHVFCDMTTEGGGWTVFQNRFNGSVNFTKTFFDYENGFGDLNGEFWLGLKFVQELTKKPSFLRMEILLDNWHRMSALISHFKLVGSQYTLMEPNLPGSFIDESVGANFTTIDRDSAIPCVSEYGGGWWYPDIDCDLYLNMNGMYGKTAGKNGEILTKSIMMFKRM